MAWFNFGKGAASSRGEDRSKEKQKEISDAKKEEVLKSAKIPALPKGGSHEAPILSKDLIIGPRITEKAAYVAEDGVYVFNVRKGATKGSVAAAIRALYNVRPRKVRLVAIKTKKVSSRGRAAFGVTAGGRKAYVYLRKGEKIEII